MEQCAVWLCHQFLSGFRAKDYVPQVARQSRLSANNMGDIEMIPRAVHISPAIYLKAEENLGKPRKTWGSGTSMKAVWPVIVSNEVSYLWGR